MVVKIKEIVKYNGHSVKANGSFDLNFKAMYSELTNSMQVLQLLNNDVTIVAKPAGSKAIKLGVFRVKNVKFSEDTIKSMANHITNNKVKQGGAIKDLKSGILSVCAQHRSEFAFKSIEISYIPNEDPNVVGDFTACVLTKDNDTAKASQDDGTESKSERKKKCEFEVFSDDEDDCHELNSNDGDDCLELNSSDE